MGQFSLEPLEARQMMSAAPLPRPTHIVVVVEENHSLGSIIGSPDAPFINSLAKGGALFTRSFGVTHPSQPNYVALFSGATHGVIDDSCPQVLTGPNLATTLAAKHLSFGGFSEDLPEIDSTVCSAGDYARKHNPWVNFLNVPGSVNRSFADFPSALPTVSFVIPNQLDDMHDGTVAQGDQWLKDHLGHFSKWSQKHNTLLIVTWDEDDNQSSNQIPTIFFGAHVKPGWYTTPINHFNVLRTIEDIYGLKHLGQTAQAKPIREAFK